MYSDLLSSILAKYRVQRARTDAAAQCYLDARRPVAILLPDPAITLKQSSALLKKVKNYVQAGGVAIFACNFSSFIRPLDMNAFWKKAWELDWKSGNYTRTNVYLNRCE
jgi:hypothetical protein